MSRFAHHCHAAGCSVATAPRMFMCLRHWRMVPAAMQQRIWATYREGQEIDKRPSAEYLKAAQGARRAVALKEGKKDVFDREEAATAALAREIVDAVAKVVVGDDPEAAAKVRERAQRFADGGVVSPTPAAIVGEHAPDLFALTPSKPPRKRNRK